MCVCVCLYLSQHQFSIHVHGEVTKVQQHLIRGELLFRHIIAVQHNDGNAQEQMEIVRLWKNIHTNIEKHQRTQPIERRLASLRPISRRPDANGANYGAVNARMQIKGKPLCSPKSPCYLHANICKWIPWKPVN